MLPAEELDRTRGVEIDAGRVRVPGFLGTPDASALPGLRIDAVIGRRFEEIGIGEIFRDLRLELPFGAEVLIELDEVVLRQALLVRPIGPEIELARQPEIAAVMRGRDAVSGAVRAIEPLTLAPAVSSVVA